MWDRLGFIAENVAFAISILALVGFSWRIADWILDHFIRKGD